MEFIEFLESGYNIEWLLVNWMTKNWIQMVSLLQKYLKEEAKAYIMNRGQV